MATSKKNKSAKTTKKTNFKNRISGVKTAGITQLLTTGAEIGVGTIGQNFIKKAVAKMLPSMATGIMAEVIPLAVGVALPMIVKNNKTVNNIAGGVIGMSLYNIVKTTGIVSGTGLARPMIARVPHKRVPFRQPAMYPMKRVAGVVPNPTQSRIPMIAGMATGLG